jgi:hypothetical protein
VSCPAGIKTGINQRRGENRTSGVESFGYDLGIQWMKINK